MKYEKVLEHLYALLIHIIFQGFFIYRVMIPRPVTDYNSIFKSYELLKVIATTKPLDLNSLGLSEFRDRFTSIRGIKREEFLEKIKELLFSVDLSGVRIPW